MTVLIVTVVLVFLLLATSSFANRDGTQLR
jgi:hypothetical protein